MLLGKPGKLACVVFPLMGDTDLASRLRYKKRFKAVHALNNILVFASWASRITEYKGQVWTVLLMSCLALLAFPQLDLCVG